MVPLPPAMAPRRSGRLTGCLTTAIALAVVAAYYVARFRGAVLMFFFLDDFWNISEAAQIDVRSPLDLGQFLRPTHNGFTLYRPLTQTAYFFLLHALFGYDAAGYHAVQLLAHIVTAWLVLLVTRRLTESTWVGLATALIYASAPGHLEAVYWVSAFTMTGTTLLLLLMLWLWLSTSGWRRIAGVTLAQAAALLASEHGVIGPVLLGLVAALGPTREPWRRTVRQLALPTLLVAAYAVAKIVYLVWLRPMPAGFPYAPSFDAVGWVQRTGQYAVACFAALKLREWSDATLTALGAALILLVPVAAWLRWRWGPRYSLLAVGSAVFGVSLLPVLPLAEHVYEYYVGTAAFGAALALVGCCSIAGRYWRPAAVAVAALVVILDVQVRPRIVARDLDLQLILTGSTAGSHWLRTIAQISTAYPQVREVFVPVDVVTRWIFESGGYRPFLPPRPAVILFDPQRRPTVGTDQAVLWVPASASTSTGSVGLPGATPRLGWLRALAGGPPVRPHEKIVDVGHAVGE